MLKPDLYYFRAVEDPKLFISLDWYTYEDHWFQTKIFGKPMYSKETVERREKKNKNRHKWFKIKLDVCGLKMILDIKLKKVGNYYYGRDLSDKN